MNIKKWLPLCIFSILASGCSESNAPDPMTTDCVEGTKMCATGNTGVMICQNGRLILAEACLNGMICSNSVCTQNTTPTPVCVDGTKICDTVQNRLLICQSGTYFESKACLASEICNPTALDCTAKSFSGCTDGVFRCENNGVQKCVAGNWATLEQCTQQQTCNAGSGKCDKIVECSDGVSKCDTDLSRVLICSGGSWTVQEACDSNSTCDMATLKCKAGCTENELKCSPDGSLLMKCASNNWGISEDCSAGQMLCNDQTKACEKEPECVDGEHLCSQDEKGIMVCTGGQWQPEKTCLNNEKCVAGNCISSCTEGAASCNAGNAVNCTNGSETVSECGADDICIIRNNVAVCEPKLCNDGEFKCEGNTQKTCQNNIWDDNPCATGFKCDEAARGCVEIICTEGNTQCHDNNVETCTNNDWNVSKVCKSSEMCSDNSKCVAVECSKGEKRCRNGNVEICNNNAFEVNTECTDNQICSQSGKNASCVDRICIEGSYQCKGNVSQRCDGNSWKDVQTCDAATQVCLASTGVCTRRICSENETRCSSDSKSIEICKDNSWVQDTKCSATGKLCYNFSNNPTCMTKICDSGVSCDNNVLSVCENNAYTLSLACLNNQVCNPKDKTCDPKPECTPGEYHCKGSTLQICQSNGFYKDYKNCIGYEICDDSQGKCVDTSTCKDGEYTCDGQILKNCASGQWHTLNICDSSQNCDAKEKKCTPKPVCETGQYSCSGKQLRICDSTRQWKNQTLCTEKQTCNETLAKCTECESGEFSCNGLTLRKCINGSWQNTSTVCKTGQTCDASLQKCTECSGSEYRCTASNNLEVCSNYLWVNAKTCTSTQTCDASQMKCVENAVCGPGKYSCKDNVLRICDDAGQWKDSKTCNKDTETCDAEGKTCKLKPVCTPDDTQCDGNTLKTCDASGQWTSSDCKANQICVTDAGKSSCVDTMVLPTWCNIQHVNDDTDQGYGRVLMPSEVNISDIEAKFVCGDISTPVKSWELSADAVHNAGCTDCNANTEFVSYSMKGAAGNYQCTYEFEFGPQTIACVNGKDGDLRPIILDSKTTMTNEQTFPITLPSRSTEAPTWCNFKHYDASTSQAYGRILLPGSTTAAQVSAYLICGNIDQPAVNWRYRREAKQNLFCNDCYSNTEFISAPLADKLNIPEGDYACAFRMDVNGKSYVCTTNSDYGAPGAPVELTSTKLLNSTDKTNVPDDPITVWGVHIQY